MASTSRRYPTRPLLGVGALIFNAEDAILLIERGQEPLKGFWTLPGGLVEPGERLEDAVRREIFEETGLEVVPLKVIEIFQRIMQDSEGHCEYHYVVIDYLCEKTGGDLRAASDVAAAEWVRPQDFPSYKLSPGTQPVIEKGYQSRS